MKRPLEALLVVALVAAAAAEPPAPSPPLPAPAVFLHLSDLHFSVNVRKYWRQFGDREGDALLWASQVVPRLGAAAIVVTGDITDSKTARGEGLQQEAEWLAYAGLLRALNASGLPLPRVLDVPGNHDTFNLPARGAPNDFFSRHAAEGRRRASPHERVFVHPLPRAGDAQDAAGGCPAAWLVGLDPTPDPGLRSPTNFAGLATAAFMEEAAAALQGLARRRGEGCEAPLLAYCHYPLSTVDSTRRHGAGPLGALRHAAGPVRPMQGLTQMLAEHGVAAVLSGHLHSAFGQRLHRLHPTPAGGRLAELETAAWKDDRRFRLVGVDGASLSFLDLFFHTRSAPSMPGRPDAAAMRDPAWRAAYERRGWAVTALEPSAAMVDHAVLVTHPPDARYAPLGAPQTEGQPGEQLGEQLEGGSGGWVRALVYCLEGDEEAVAAAGKLSVELEGFLPSGGKLFARAMQLQPAGGDDAGGGGGTAAPLLFAAAGDTTVSCVGVGGDPAGHCRPPAEHALIQVSVRRGDGPVSRSPRTPVALRCASLTSSHQRCWVDAGRGAPLPLRPSFLEWLGLAFNWPVLVHRIFLLVWAIQAGGMLLLPRLVRRRLLPIIAATPLLQCRPPQAPAAPVPASSPARRLARACVAHLLWPLAALVLCADATGVWASLMAHSLLLLLGPWLAYAALDGRPAALMFHYGVVGRLGGQGPAGGPAAAAPWRFLGTPDTMFVSLAHSLFCWLPATLWVACVVARRTQLQPHSPPASRSASSDSNGGGGGGSAAARSLLGGGAQPVPCGRWSFSSPQLAALGLLAWINWAALYSRALAFMTPISLLFSPGFAWTLPLAALLVTAWGGPRRRGPTPGKGE